MFFVHNNKTYEIKVYSISGIWCKVFHENKTTKQIVALNSEYASSCLQRTLGWLQYVPELCYFRANKYVT